MRKYVDRSEINLDDSNMLSHGYEKDENGKWFYYDAKVQNLKAIDVTDEEYAEICKYCPPLQVASNTENKDDELLKQVDSIRKMVKFFTILMIISLVLAVILGMIIGLKPSYY